MALKSLQIRRSDYKKECAQGPRLFSIYLCSELLYEKKMFEEKQEAVLHDEENLAVSQIAHYSLFFTYIYIYINFFLPPQ